MVEQMKDFKDRLLGFILTILSFYTWLMKIVVTNDKSKGIEFIEFIILIGFMCIMFYFYLLYFNKTKMKIFNIVINIPIFITFIIDLFLSIQNKTGLGNIIITLIMVIYIILVEMGCFDIYTGYRM